ncbi:MAG: class I SAM-dependent methyltransferase [Holdemanella sp.]|nr:class I SAM-dependent methyltransferase [Holdemanella sp.]
MKYQDINAETFDRWIEKGWIWGQSVSHEVYADALKGKWDVLLTPTKPVPHAWFGDLKDKKILGLASGGGQQMPIFAALGAECTVLDYSIKQLESEEIVSRREGYEIEIIRGDMTQPLPFEDETFDLIFHPVSNCYVEKVEPIWKECFRVLKNGGILLSGLDNGLNYAFDEMENKLSFKLPFNPLENEDHRKEMVDKDYGIQFSHTIVEQIGAQIKAGFTLVDLYDDINTEGYLHDYNVPTFWATKSIKCGK